jgi:hypothetical protein
MNPWVIAAEIGISIGLHELNSWLSETPPDKAPNQLANLPKMETGEPIPLVFGRVRVRRPTVLWYGGYKRYESGEIWGYPTSQSIAPFWYGINILFSVGIPHSPIAANTGARLLSVFKSEGDGPNDKIDLGGGLADTQNVSIHTQLGHVNHEIVYSQNVGQTFPPDSDPPTGRIQFFAGGSGQVLSDGVPPPTPGDDSDLNEISRFMQRAGVDPTLIPGYRNQMLVALTGDHARFMNTPGSGQNPSNYLACFVLGPDNTLPPLSFEVLSRSAIFQPTLLFANGDANPVDVIYQILTSTWSCMNADPAQIDTGAFTGAAGALWNEGHGYSNVIDTQRSGRQVLQDIVNQISAVLYLDPATEKVSIKLLRNDYNPATIAYFGPQHVIDFEYTPGGWPDTINKVTVKFTNRDSAYADDIATAFNQASAVAQDAATALGNPGGRTRVVPVEYPGVSNLALARSLAQRDLNLLSQPLSQLHITFNRLLDIHGVDNAAHLRPGSVFKLTIPATGPEAAIWPNGKIINDVIFRVTKVDPGQHGDSKVVVDAVADVFNAGAAPGFPGGGTIVLANFPYPLLRRVFAEAPYWMQKYLANLGVIATADVQRIMAVARPSDASTAMSVMTAKASAVNSLPAQIDIPTSLFPLSAKVATTYPRTADPYDTTTGLVITSFSPDDSTGSTFLAIVNTAADIQTDGVGVALLGTELIAFESATDLGGTPKQFRLNNVWRALLDTAPKDHAVGEVIYFLQNGSGLSRVIGSRGWDNVLSVLARMSPQLGFFSGSGRDPSDLITIRRRSKLPMRCAALQLAGKNIAGTQGIPAVAGQFTKVSLLEEGVDVFAFHRDRLTSTIVRGDAADESPTEIGITYLPLAQKVGQAAVSLGAALIPANPIAGGQGYTTAIAGHGQIDLILQTRRTVQTGETGIGFPVGTTLVNWDSPSVRITAPPWRNLLANSRFDYNNLTTGWSVQSGQCGVGNDASSIPRDSTGFYFTGGAAGAAPTIKQIVDITGYLARKYTARLVWYQRNLNSDATTRRRSRSIRSTATTTSSQAR